MVQHLADSACRVGHPAQGNCLWGALAILKIAERSEPGSRETLQLAGIRGLVLAWHGQVADARILLAWTLEQAGLRGYPALHDRLYDLSKIVNRINASAS